MNIASTLLWVLGILNIAGSIVIGIPQIDKGGSIVFPIYILVVGIVCCVAAVGLRKKKRSAGILAIIASVLSFVSPPVVGFIIGIIIIIITLTHWKELT
jgi:hypothetical protein